MPLIATEGFRFSNVVKQELWPELGYTRTVVTVNEATAKNYVVGTLLGKVTASGKYKIAVQTAADGSQNAAGIVLQEQAIAATTDTKVLALTRGPAAVSKLGLVLDATYDLAAEKDLVYSQLEALGIMVQDTI